MSRLFSVLLCVLLVAGLMVSPASASLSEEPDEPGARVSIEFEGGTISALRPSDSPDFELQASASSNAPLAASTEAELVLLSEPVLVEASNGLGEAVGEIEHRIEVDPATESLPARIRSFVPGIELDLEVNTSEADNYVPHEVSVYRRASASEPWTELPSAYDQGGTGSVSAHTSLTGEFAVLAPADALQANAPDGPTVVLDPDNDLAKAVWPSSGEEVGELEKSFELANAVSERLSSECNANVILTRDSELVDPVASSLRATVARNAEPDLTLTLAFNALNENSNEPFWGANRSDSGGTRVWAPDRSVRFGERFLDEVEAYTTRPAPEGINQESALLPYASFVDPAIGSYVHLEALFLDNAFDQPVVESGFETIVDWVSATIINELASQGRGCGDAPTTPPEGKLAELRNLGYQNYLAYGADPVAFENGNFLHDESLFVLTGVGDQVIDMSLTFNNLDDRNTAFGEGWSFAYGTSIQLDGSGAALVRLGDGRSFYYPFDGTQWEVPDGANTTLERVGSQLELTFNDSSRILFDERDFQTWVMAEMIDRQGNSMSFSWGRRVSDFVYELLEIVDEAGQTVALTPNSAGQVSKIAHPDGREWNLSYEGQKLSSITDPRGVVRTFVYTGQGWLESVSVSQGGGALIEFVTNQYDGFGRVTAQTDAEGNTRTISYGAVVNGEKQTTYTDAVGNETVYRFDGDGKLIETVDDLGGSAKNLYEDPDDEYNITARVDERGQTWRTVFDDDGRPLQMTDAIGNVSTYAYNSFGDLIEMSEPDGLGGERTTSFEVNSQGRATRITLDNGSFTTSEYDEHGDVVSSTDANGNTTTFAYDERGNLIATTDALLNVERATYTLSNQVETRTDANGNTTTFAYDGVDNLIERTDPLGGVWANVYGLRNELLSETDPLGRTTTFAYDANLNMTRVDFPDGTSQTYEFDAEYNVTRATDRRGNSISTLYDGLNRPTTVTDPLGAQWTTRYDAVGNVIEMVDPDGDRAQMVYDGLNRVITEIDAEGHSWSTTYDEAGNVTTLTAPDGTTIEGEFDVLGRPLATVDEEGQRSTFAYDLVGNLVASTDRRGYTSVAEFDELNRLIKVVNPDGGWVATEYDPVGNVIATTSPIGGIARFEYDERDWIVATVDEVGGRDSFSYDAVGNQVRHVDAEGHSWVTEYDSMNRPVAFVSPVGDTERLTYDGADNVVEQTMPDGRVNKSIYDARNRLTEVIENHVVGARATADVNVRTVYQISPGGDLTQRTNPNGAVTAYTHDRLGRVRTTTDPLGRTETLSYNSVGLITSRIDGNGREQTFSYYPDRLLRNQTFADGSSESYTYDADNFRVSMVDSVGTTTWEHDWRGNETFTSDANDQTVGHGYDLAGNVTELTYPDGLVSVRTFDPASRMISLTDRSGTIHYERDGLGRRSRITHPNKIVTNFGYDPEGNLASIDYDRVGKSSRDRTRFDYTYTPDDLVASQEITYYDVTRETAIYSYDGLDRLVGSEMGSRTGHGSKNRKSSTSYSYDAAGNRISMATTDDPSTRFNDPMTVDYEYDAADQLVNETRNYSRSFKREIDRDYDENGNLVSESSQAFFGGRKFGRSSTEKFAYDFEDQLIADGNNRWKRDGLGRAIAWSKSGRFTNERSYVDQVFDGAHLIRQDGRSIEETYFRDSSQVLVSESVFWDRKDQSYVVGRNETVYSTADSRGRVGLPTEYGDFGERQGASFRSPAFGFAGEVQDKQNNRLHFHARSYDPKTGRFLQTDPVAGSLLAPATQHRYQYALNAPTTVTDFLGLFIDIPDPFEIIEREIEQGIEDLKGFADDKVVSPIQGAVGWTTDKTTGALSDAYTATYGTIIEGLAILGTGSGTSSNPAVDSYRREVADSYSQENFQAQVADAVAAAIVDATPLGSANCLVGNEPGCSKVVAVAEVAFFVAPTPPVAKPVAAALRPVATLTSRVARPVLGPVSSVARPVFKPVANGLESFGQRIRPHPQAAPANSSLGDLAAMCRSNSFVPGTAVLMADGAAKPIEEIEIGDYVWASDPETGEAGQRRVIDTIVGDGTKHLVDVWVDGAVITATDKHPFWVDGQDRWIDAEDLAAGDLLQMDVGTTIAIDAIATRMTVQRVHNLTVEGIHTYHVLANDSPVLVHNCSIVDKAAELRTRATRNRVSIETPNGRMSIDLQGRSHYEGTIGSAVDTPHVKFETRHVGPNGQVSYTSGPVRPATHDDLRLVARILGERGL